MGQMWDEREFVAVWRERKREKEGREDEGKLECDEGGGEEEEEEDLRSASWDVEVRGD